MVAEKLNAETIELICEHLSMEADELIVESTTSDVATISSRWNECSRDMKHLPCEERANVLQRTAPFRPRMIGDVAVTLYNEVQVIKGKPRVTAVIVDCGDIRHIIMGV